MNRALFVWLHTSMCMEENEIMSGKNRWLVADEPVEFEVKPVEVHRDFRQITEHFNP